MLFLIAVIEQARDNIRKALELFFETASQEEEINRRLHLFDGKGLITQNLICKRWRMLALLFFLILFVRMKK